MKTELLTASEGIRIPDHSGTWYIVETGLYGKPYHPINDWTLAYMLEHEQRGDEVNGLIVDGCGNVLCDEVWNGWLDLEYELDVVVEIWEDLLH